MGSYRRWCKVDKWLADNLFSYAAASSMLIALFTVIGVIDVSWIVSLLPLWLSFAYVIGKLVYNEISTGCGERG